VDDVVKMLALAGAKADRADRDEDKFTDSAVNETCWTSPVTFGAGRVDNTPTNSDGVETGNSRLRCSTTGGCLWRLHFVVRGPAQPTIRGGGRLPRTGS